MPQALPLAAHNDTNDNNDMVLPTTTTTTTTTTTLAEVTARCPQGNTVTDGLVVSSPPLDCSTMYGQFSLSQFAKFQNPRTVAYFHFNMPSESSNLPVAGAIFPD